MFSVCQLISSIDDLNANSVYIDNFSETAFALTIVVTIKMFRKQYFKESFPKYSLCPKPHFFGLESSLRGRPLWLVEV